MKVLWIILIIVVIVGGIFLFSSLRTDKSESAETLEWKNTELTDVSTGNKFKINDFNKPVLLESFAVWCPTCKQQQDKIKELHDEVGDSIISISLDTDPNEDEGKVREHIQLYDITGYLQYLLLNLPRL